MQRRAGVVPTALQNPYRDLAGEPEPGRAARAASVGAFAVGAALAGGILTGQAAHADESDGPTACATDEEGRWVSTVDGTPCEAGSDGERSGATAAGEDPDGDRSQDGSTDGGGTGDGTGEEAGTGGTVQDGSTAPEATTTAAGPGTAPTAEVVTVQEGAGDPTAVADGTTGGTTGSTAAVSTVPADAAAAGAVPGPDGGPGTAADGSTSVVEVQVTSTGGESPTSVDPGAAPVTPAAGDGFGAVDPTTGEVVDENGDLVGTVPTAATDALVATGELPAGDGATTAATGGGPEGLAVDPETGEVVDANGDPRPDLFFDADTGAVLTADGAGSGPVPDGAPATTGAEGPAPADTGQVALSVDAATGQVLADGVPVPGAVVDPTTGAVVTSDGATPDPAAVSPALLAATTTAATGTTAPDGGLLVDPATGALHTADGTPVPLRLDPATGAVTASAASTGGPVSPALLAPVPTGAGTAGTGAADDPPIDTAALQAAFANLTEPEREALRAAGAVPPGIDVAAASPEAAGQGRGPDRGFGDADKIALGHLLSIAGAALQGATDGTDGNVGDLLRQAGIKVALDYAGRVVTDLTGTEDWARAATPGLGALLNAATSGGEIDWQQVQEAAVSGIAAEGIRQIPGVEGGPFPGIAPAGGAAIGALLSPDGLTGEEAGAIAEDLAIGTVENLIKDAAPGVAGAVAANGVTSILGMFANPDQANPVHFLSAIANGFVPGLGLAFTPLANWFAKEEQRREFEQQMEQLNAEAASTAMAEVSQFRDPATMAPLTLSDGTTFRWADGLPVLDPNTGQLRPYGTAFYQDGMDTINRMMSIGEAVPHAARLAQEAAVARIQANIAAGLNGDGTPRSEEQQRAFDRLAELRAEGSGDVLVEKMTGMNGLFTPPDPADVEVEQGTATGWRAHAIAVEQNEAARALNPLHAPTGITARETDARADAAEAGEQFRTLYMRTLWSMAGPRYSGGRAGRMVDAPPAPDVAELDRLRTEAIRNVAALRLAGSSLADDAELSFAPPDFPCDPEGWDEEQCGPRYIGGPRGPSPERPEEITQDAIDDEVEAPSPETRQLAAEITAARERLNTPQAVADYERVVEGPCGEDGHAGQVNCYGAWNELLHPRGGRIPYPREVAELMARAHAVYVARKELLGHDVLRDQRTYITGAPLQPRVPQGPPAT
jgi:hypothetical protein